MSPLYRKTFDRSELAERFPDRFTNPNKIVFLEAVRQPTPPGSMEVTRWGPEELPGSRSVKRPELVTRAGYFTYDEPDAQSEMHWHLNFANYDLFSAYAGSLLAQDEMQVLEHPDLARVRHALEAENLSTFVTDREGPTPFTLVGVPRFGAIDTSPGPGRPGGLYGNRFAEGSPDQVRRATIRIDPPSLSNIVAMEAPASGRGIYSGAEIAGILTTAMTGFRAAVEESRRLSSGAAAVVHTGWWGCGAYGGNQELMALLQLIAAEWAEVDRLVFHIGDVGSEPILAQAREGAVSLPASIDTQGLIDAIQGREYRWGESDGN